MHTTARVYLSPIAALVTLAIGVSFVYAARSVAVFYEPRQEQATEENIGVTSTENFKSLLPQKITQSHALACYDPTILPIWHELKKDKVFTDLLGSSSGVVNCSDIIGIEKADLDGDGNEDFLVRGNSPHLCSATRDCGFWVFEEEVSQFRKLLASTDYVDVVGLEDPVQKSGSHGYSNLMLKGHRSANETTFRTYEYNGRQYVETRCMDEVPKYRREGEGTMELIPCAELERRD